MTINQKGWVVVMYSHPDPSVPHYTGGLFGPVTTKGVNGLSENLCTNGLKIFTEAALGKRAAAERSVRFKREGFRVKAAEVELSVAQNPKDWEALRGFGSYIVAVGIAPEYIELYGSATDGKERVLTAHDSWAPFYQNRFTPFTDFERVVGGPGWGVAAELSRQSLAQVRIIGFRIRRPKGF